MIMHTNNSIVYDIPEYSVVISPMSCTGKPISGLGMSLAKRFPLMNQDLIKYCNTFKACTWEKDSHYDEIYGTWHRYNIKDNIIVCNAFCQMSSSDNPEFKYDIWDKILRKIKIQTQNVKARYGMKWSIHCEHMMGCNKSNDNWEMLMELIDKHFKDNDIEFFIHE